MNIFLSSTAELIREHRHTASLRKKQKIAAELQRRHDAWNIPFGFDSDKWWIPTGEQEFVRNPFEPGGGHFEPIYRAMRRFEFALWLP